MRVEIELPAGTKAIGLQIPEGIGEVLIHIGSPPVQSPPVPQDEGFLETLSPAMRPVGERLLQGVRQQVPGRLRETKNRRWLNRPENTFCLWFQTTKRDIVFTIAGVPEEFSSDDVRTLDLKPDRPAYARGRVATMSDLDAAIRVIAASWRRHHAS